jgi:nucleoside-diphosphate-sugar epimerase
MKKKALVTGATGFVGSNLVRRLLKEGHSVSIITRKTSNKWRLKDILPELDDYMVDLLEFRQLKKVVERIKPETIFHLAAAGIYGGWHLPEKELIDVNFTGTVNLINACKEIKYRSFVNAGSSSEYGPKDKPMKESDICEPVNMYGITKLAATLYGSSVAKAQNRPIITLRLFSPFGPYDIHSRLVTYAIVTALKDKELRLADPDAVRDYIYIDDVMDLYLKSMDKADRYKGEVFNVGTGSQTKVSYIIDKVVDFTGSKSPVKWHSAPANPFDAKRWEADIEKSSRCFNWRPKYSAREGLKKTVLWFKDNLTPYGRV